MVLALGAAAVSAPAQQTIVFSKPADASADKANSFMDNSQPRVNAGDYKAPRHLFNDYTPDFPMPKPVIVNYQDASVRDALNKRKNWTMLTPEQILGVPTPEQIMGVADPNGESKLSLEEQYLLRESRASAFAATNGRPNAALLRRDASPFDRNRDEQNPFSRTPFSRSDNRTQPGSARYLSDLLNANGSDSLSGDEQKNNSAWTSVFAQPAQPKQTPEQLANMERFRALMEPSSPPDKTPATARYSVTPTPAVDPYLQPQPRYNPAGHSIDVLEDHISRPTGIQPLPGITGPVKTPPQTKPAWQAQLPPWLQDGPQPHSLNRNY